MKWKYKVIALGNDAEVNAKALSKHGAEGWELVVVQGDGTVRFAYLKLETVDLKRKIKL
jgi:hypothetical protein